MNTTKTPHEIMVCTDCTSGIVNDDWTHLDNQDDADSAMASIAGTLELLGQMTHTARTLDPAGWGYWTCPICGEVKIGMATVFEAEKDGRG